MQLGELVSQMRLGDVGVDVVDVGGDRDREIVDVTHDSRAVDDRWLFCAVTGQSFDGHTFAPGAVSSGAAALLVERALDLQVAQLVVTDVRKAMPVAAAAIHGWPSRSIDVFGVTGTNGKTTTCHLLASIVRAARRTVEVIGTLTGVHTTPESTEWQRRLRGYVNVGVEVLAAEVSSHALDQGRVEATEFAVAAFSNLSPDHLDYHGDLETYFEAKARLFDGRAKNELINVDDPWGTQLAKRRPQATKVNAGALPILHRDLAGSTVTWRGDDLHIPLPGAMNIANGVLAAEAASVLGLDDESIRRGLAGAGRIAGRMEVVTTLRDDAPTVIVDYSHTPESIERALATLRAIEPGRAISIVFGCGGDRDASKRPAMGRAAEVGADRIIVTSDNPRTEDPLVIIDDALSGMEAPEIAIVEPDRRNAIALAISSATRRDVVLIAGKGHETTQTVGDRVIPFSDLDVARWLLEGDTA